MRFSVVLAGAFAFVPSVTLANECHSGVLGQLQPLKNYDCIQKWCNTHYPHYGKRSRGVKLSRDVGSLPFDMTPEELESANAATGLDIAEVFSKSQLAARIPSNYQARNRKLAKEMCRCIRPPHYQTTTSKPHPSSTTKGAPSTTTSKTTTTTTCTTTQSSAGTTKQSTSQEAESTTKTSTGQAGSTSAVTSSTSAATSTTVSVGTSTSSSPAGSTTPAGTTTSASTTEGGNTSQSTSADTTSTAETTSTAQTTSTAATTSTDTSASTSDVATSSTAESTTSAATSSQDSTSESTTLDVTTSISISLPDTTSLDLTTSLETTTSLDLTTTTGTATTESTTAADTASTTLTLPTTTLDVPTTTATATTESTSSDADTTSTTLPLPTTSLDLSTTSLDLSTSTSVSLPTTTPELPTTTVDTTSESTTTADTTTVNTTTVDTTTVDTTTADTTTADTTSESTTTADTTTSDTTAASTTTASTTAESTTTESTTAAESTTTAESTTAESTTEAESTTTESTTAAESTTVESTTVESTTVESTTVESTTMQSTTAETTTAETTTAETTTDSTTTESTTAESTTVESTSTTTASTTTESTTTESTTTASTIATTTTESTTLTTMVTTTTTSATTTASTCPLPSAPVASITCNSQTYVYQDLAGYGALRSNARDSFGDTLGGFGSSVAFDANSWTKDGNTYTGTMYALPDRGWNTQGTLNYQNRIHKFTVTLTLACDATVANPSSPNIQLTYQSTTLLVDANGAPTTGLDANAAGPYPVMLGVSVPAATFSGDGFTNAMSTPTQTLVSIDAEGLVLNGDGSYWVSDEYGPYIYKFSTAGVMQAVIRPPPAYIPQRNGADSFASNNPPIFAPDRVPSPADPTTGRSNNQGFEGLTQSPDGTRLYVLIQSALRQEGGSSNTGRRNARFLVYDLTTTTPTAIAEYVVPLPSYVNNNGNTRIAAQSEIHYISPTQFLVLARDSGAGHGAGFSNSIYRDADVFDITTATNIIGQYDATGNAVTAGPNSATLKTGIIAATYCKFLDFNINAQLNRFGVRNGGAQDSNLLNEKWESLALLPVNPDDPTSKDYFLFSVSDNDFITQDGYLNGGAFRYTDSSGYNVDNQVLAFRVTLPLASTPLKG